MHRGESSFRRHHGSGSVRRFSFRRKPTRESIPEPTSTWSFNNEHHEWQLLRGNIQGYLVSIIINDQTYTYMCLHILILSYFSLLCILVIIRTRVNYARKLLEYCIFI